MSIICPSTKWTINKLINEINNTIIDLNENGWSLNLISKNKKEKKLNKNTEIAVAKAAPSIPNPVGRSSK